MRFFMWFAALLLSSHMVAWAQKVPGKELSSKDMTAMESPQPLSQGMYKPLPELKGVVSWKTLAQVEAVRQKDRFVPKFSGNITALDKKEIRLQGFMMPLDMGEKQKRFILTSLPPSCSFCLPGGPDQLVEVQAKTPVKYGFEPIVVTGRFVVLKDDEMGLYYRLTDAAVVAQ